MSSDVSSSAVLAFINEAFPDVHAETSADGMVQITMTPKGRHQAIVGRLSAWLLRTIDDRDGSRVLPGLGVQAGGAQRSVDLVVLHEGAQVLDTIVYQPAGLVALAVEVLSNSTARVDRTEKMGDYARAGIRHYWLVDQQDLVHFFALDAATGGYGPEVDRMDLANLLALEHLPADVTL